MKLRLATTLLLGTSLAGMANADGSDLVVFDWAGYDDPGFYQSYVDAHGSDPSFSFFTDEEEAFQKMRAGFKVDAGHPCSQSVPKWMEAGLLNRLRCRASGRTLSGRHTAKPLKYHQGVHG